VSEMARAESGCVKEKDGEGGKADGGTGREVGSELEGGNGKEGVRGGWVGGWRIGGGKNAREVNGMRQSERASERARGRKRQRGMERGGEGGERDVNTMSESERECVCVWIE
jgi:hypothetical protein